MAKFDRKEEIVKTMLLDSTRSNDWNMLQIILKNCFNKTRLFGEIYNDQGDGLLHIACRKEYLEATKILIANGLNVDYRNSDGDTCLHITSQTGNAVILHLLFEAGANPITKNNQDKQPVDITESKEIRELLRQYSLRSAELQLMRKFNTLKEMVAEEERKEKYESINQKYFEEDKFQSHASLERIDSGICSDIDSNEKLDINNNNDINNDSNNNNNNNNNNNVDDIPCLSERVKSLHIPSPKNLGKNSRSCKSGCEQWTLSSIQISRSPIPATYTPNNVHFEVKDKQLTKSTSAEGTRRTTRQSDNFRRRKRLSLPDFRIHGPTESYV